MPHLHYFHKNVGRHWGLNQYIQFENWSIPGVCKGCTLNSTHVLSEWATLENYIPVELLSVVHGISSNQINLANQFLAAMLILPSLQPKERTTVISSVLFQMIAAV